MKIFIISLIIIFPIFKSYSNIRNCLVLPVNLKSYSSDQVFDSVEKYLKRSNWCIYQNSSQLYDLLRSYSQKNLSYTDNPEVMQLISTKTNSESIIRIDEDKKRIRLRVFDASINPSYVIHFDMGKIESINDLLTQVFESLDSYSKLIPYDAVVLGKNDRVVTISSGKEFDFYKGRSVSFISDLKRSNHPLYKFVVEYDFKKFCNGVVLQSDFGMSLIELNKSEPSCELVKRGTFVKKEKFSDNFKKISASKFKKNRIFTLVPSIGISSTSLTLNNSGKIILSGFSSTVETKITARLAKNYFLLSDIKLGISSMSAEEGSASDQSPLSSNLTFGGRYQLSNIKKTKINFDLAFNLFDLFLANDSTSSISKFGHTSLFASSDVHHTFSRSITGVLGVGFSLYNTQEFESNYLGTVESSNRYRFKIGAWIENVYKFKIYTGLNVDSININFTGEDKDIQLTDLGFLSSLFFQF